MNRISKLYNYTPEQLQKMLDNSISYSEVLHKCDMLGNGGNYNTIKKIIKEYGLSIDKMQQNYKTWLISNAKDKDSFKKETTPLQDIFNNTKPMQGSKLLKRLIKEGIKENKCEICGLYDWNGQPLTFHLHHKNGNHYDNSLDNLQILCPNCHSQTDTYTGRNNNKKKNKIAQVQFSRKKRNISSNTCSGCGKNLKIGKTLCYDCALKKLRRNKNNYNIETVVKMFEKEKINFKNIAQYFDLDISIIINDYKKYKGVKNLVDIFGDRDFLKNAIRNYSFIQLSEMMGVSDKTIVKWCKKLNLPFKKNDIQKYTNEEWLLI